MFCRVIFKTKAFDRLHKKHMELLKQQGELEKENKQLKEELFDTRHQLDNIFKYRRQMEGFE